LDLSLILLARPHLVSLSIFFDNRNLYEYTVDVNINAEVLSPQSIKITWDPLSLTDEVITNYIVSYKALDSFGVNGTVPIAAVVTSIIINGLEEFVTYTITLQPVSNGVVVRGLTGNTVQVTTWSDGEKYVYLMIGV